MSKPLIAALVIASFNLSPQSSHAADAVNQADYTISLAGLPLAYAQFTTSIKSTGYDISAKLATSGLARIITDTHAQISVSGRVQPAKWSPEQFSFRYTYGKKSRAFDTAFRNGDVTSSIIKPKPDYSKRKNWEPTRPEDLKAVFDPVSALIVPSSTEPCRDLVKIYDGESRINLRLAPKRTAKFKATGYDDQAVVCSIRYEPVSGHKRRSHDVEYVRNLTHMEIWFAKSPRLNVYAPVYLSVPTKFGLLSITATRFEG
jgi:hypothetical protein